MRNSGALAAVWTPLGWGNGSESETGATGLPRPFPHLASCNSDSASGGRFHVCKSDIRGPGLRPWVLFNGNGVNALKEKDSTDEPGDASILKKLEASIKHFAWLVGLFGLLSAGQALACSSRLPGGTINTEWSTEMTTRKGQPCVFNAISLGTVSVTGGSVLQQPRIGKAGVKPGPGFGYVSQRTGRDSFVVGFRGHDRYNNPYTVRIRVNVTVTD
jgi:hypothetical protein